MVHVVFFKNGMAELYILLVYKYCKSQRKCWEKLPTTGDFNQQQQQPHNKRQSGKN